MTPRLAHWNAPTLTSAELDVDALGVDDQLVLRDVKARLFDRDVPVSVGRYPVERRIGRGGMGTVYEAVDAELGRKVALKVMLPGDANAARTKAEARTLAQLSHPNIVTVHEVGQHAERVFLAMEYIEGRTLADWLASGPSVDAILGVFRQAGQGLAAAHEAGITHRDFKPTNVLIREDGHVKVIDFGLSRAPVGEAGPDTEGDVGLTRTGALLGTPAYMSPEQFRGEPVDARTDVFAFAVVLYEALTGQRPFEGDDVHSLAKAVLAGKRPSTRNPRIPPSVWKPLSRALEADLARRPRSLAPLLEAMQHPRPRRWLPAAAVGVLLTAGVGSLTLWEFGPDAPTQDEHAQATATPPAEEVVEQDPARAEAFARLRDATDPKTRESAATDFLAAYGDDTTNAEQLLAEVAIGLALRARACPSDIDGLCVRRVRHDNDGARCPQAPAATFEAVQRDPDLMREATEHLARARQLASFQQPPQDEVGARAYREAISRLKLSTVDDGLESLLGTTLPTSLDFSDGEKKDLAASAFKSIVMTHNKQAKQLAASYGAIKGGDPQTVLRAAGHSAINALSFVWLLAQTPVPVELNSKQRLAYCSALDDQWAIPARLATDAIAYCKKNATAHDLDGSICDLAPEGFPRVVP